MEPKEWRATVKSTPVFYASPACPPLPFAGHLSSFKAFSHHLRPRKPAFLDSPAADGFAVSPYLHQGTKSVSQAAYRYGHPPTSLPPTPNVHMRARNFGKTRCRHGCIIYIFDNLSHKLSTFCFALAPVPLPHFFVF